MRGPARGDDPHRTPARTPARLSVRGKRKPEPENGAHIPTTKYLLDYRTADIMMFVSEALTLHQ